MRLYLVLSPKTPEITVTISILSFIAIISFIFVILSYLLAKNGVLQSNKSSFVEKVQKITEKIPQILF